MTLLPKLLRYFSTVIATLLLWPFPFKSFRYAESFLEGTLIFADDRIPANALLPTFFNLSERIVTVSRLEQPRNAACPMEAVFFPITAFDNFLHP